MKETIRTSIDFTIPPSSETAVLPKPASQELVMVQHKADFSLALNLAVSPSNWSQKVSVSISSQASPISRD